MEEPLNKNTRTIHGIDPYAPGGIEALLAHHRATFSDAVMEAGEGGDGGNAAGDQGAEQQGGGSSETGQQQAGGTDGRQQQAKPGDGQQQAGQNDQQGNGADDLANLSPADLAKMVRDLRKENGDSRANAKRSAAEEARNELTQSIGKALGLIKDGNEKPDAAKLTQTVTEQATENKSLKTELAVYKAASKAGADADALLDSRGFLAKLTDLDPTDSKAITKVIEDAVKDNPKLKAARAAGQSGAEFTGGSGEQRTSNKPVPLHQAVSGHYGT